MTEFALLPAAPSQLLAATPGPDLSARGYEEHEYVASGTAEASTDLGPAAFATRVVVRRPADPVDFSGTVLVEWLNVSSGDDAAPDYTYLAEEIVRRGHVWVGLSAQFIGVEGGKAVVGDLTGQAQNGLRNRLPDRFGRLSHPGDAYCYDIYSSVSAALTAPGGPLPGWSVEVLLAVGESQSAFALTTYVNDVHAAVGLFDGFLIHSRGGAALGHGRAGCGIDLDDVRKGEAVPIRADVPVLIVQTETDVISTRLNYLPARQPDSGTVRLWEIAGTAHADRWQIGEFEELLGCPDPVNRGQQAFVLRAGLRALEIWCRDGVAPPTAARLETEAVPGEGESPRFRTDAWGNVRGGVRTPAVDAAVEVLSGIAAPGVSVICALFGRSLPIPSADLRARFGSVDGYLDAYALATSQAIAAGFLLAEDRASVLAEARPDALA